MRMRQWRNGCCFFFSSRRRHTRFDCDWSSDVCSSDLYHPPARRRDRGGRPGLLSDRAGRLADRSEEHTSELQSQSNLVCRLLLEKKKKKRLQPCLSKAQKSAPETTALHMRGIVIRTLA